MKKNTYKKLTIRLCPSYEDIWVAHCFEQGASGVETIEEKISYITMAVYFTDMSIELQDVFDQFFQQFMPDSNSGIELLQKEIKANENWLDAWKVHFQPISICDHFVICPPWDAAKTDFQTKNIIINPGNGFGTGSHPTTVVALKMLIHYLEQSSKKSHSILDVGTGSGILLIAASHFSGSKLVGIDIDLPSIYDAQNNFKLNQLQNILTLCGTPQCINAPFDIVICNMMLHELKSIQLDLVRNISPSGVLIISGYYLTQKIQVLDCFYPLKVVSEINDEQWGGMIMKYP
jgi:ribosomal protein L11 methyltransferase